MKKHYTYYYERDWFPIIGALKVSGISLLVVVFSTMMADTVTMPVSLVLGTTQEKAVENSAAHYLISVGLLWTVITAAIFILSFIMIKFIQFDFSNGLFTLPYKRDYRGNKIKRYIEIEE